MNIMKLHALAAASVALVFAGVAQGQVDNTNILNSPTLNASIPQGSFVGTTAQNTFSGVYGPIISVTVSLDISGGFNGDLYAYLAGPAGGFAVLLNRVGVTSTDAFGYSDTGFNVIFDQNAAYNIHNYQLDSPSSGQLTGSWQPDGRNIDPESSGSTFDSPTPTADLTSFAGDNPNGAWTLFIADLSSGAQSTLVSWGLTVVTVPEPQTWVLVAGGVGMLAGLNRRRKI
jgi:subtilisin-like proprotein convertase family protein